MLNESNRMKFLSFVVFAVGCTYSEDGRSEIYLAKKRIDNCVYCIDRMKDFSKITDYLGVV